MLGGKRTVGLSELFHLNLLLAAVGNDTDSLSDYLVKPKHWTKTQQIPMIIICHHYEWCLSRTGSHLIHFWYENMDYSKKKLKHFNSHLTPCDAVCLHGPLKWRNVGNEKISQVFSDQPVCVGPVVCLCVCLPCDLSFLWRQRAVHYPGSLAGPAVRASVQRFPAQTVGKWEPQFVPQGSLISNNRPPFSSCFLDQTSKYNAPRAVDFPPCPKI